MTLYFITGNPNKLKEVRAILGDVIHLDLNLAEIQSSDPEEVIRAKLESAIIHHKGPLIVEDTSLHMDCLNGLPGPLIKWFMNHGGAPHLFKIAEKFGEYGAQARCTMGLYDSGEIYFFEGVVNGRIVSPKGETDFGWDPVFQPDGFCLSYAQMSKEMKNNISHRRIALDKLRDYLMKR